MSKRGPAAHSVPLAKDIENQVLDVFKSHPAEMADALILTSSLRHFSNKTAAAKYNVMTEQTENAFRGWLQARRWPIDHFPELYWIELFGPGKGWAVAPKTAAGTARTKTLRLQEGSEGKPPGTFAPIRCEKKRQQEDRKQEKQQQLKRQQQGQGQQQGQQGEQHQQQQHQQ